LQLLGKKSEVPPHLYTNKYNELVSDYENYVHIFTDGSKYDTKVAAAAACENSISTSRLTDNSSIFSAEIYAINHALNFVKDHNSKQYIIFSDSLSGLMAVQNRLWGYSLILETLEKIHNLRVNGKTVVFVWLPSHVGIKGNTDADMAAKAALAAKPDNVLIPHSDFRQYINQYFKSKWQSIWDSQIEKNSIKLNETLE
jgi:ribonuclease HI